MQIAMGRIVIVSLPGQEANGVTVFPAIVTRTFSDNTETSNGPVTVNVTVFPDQGQPRGASSLNIYDSQAEGTREGPTANYGWAPPQT